MGNPHIIDIPAVLKTTPSLVMEGTKDYLEALRPHLPPDVLQLPEERQLAYISELLSHHRHQR